MTTEVMGDHLLEGEEELEGAVEDALKTRATYSIFIARGSGM